MASSKHSKHQGGTASLKDISSVLDESEELGRRGGIAGFFTRTLAPYYWAIILGLLTSLSFAPRRWFFLMPLIMAALIVVLYRHKKNAISISYIFGISAYTIQNWWIYISLHNVSNMPAYMAAPLTFLLPMYLALYPALVAWAWNKFTNRAWVRVVLVYPALWTLAEILRGKAFTGFGWGEVGYSQISSSPLAGFAPLMGIHLVTWATMTIAALVAYMFISKKLSRGLFLTFAAIFIVAGGQYGKARNWTVPTGVVSVFSLVQGNVPQSLKFDPENDAKVIQMYYDKLVNAKGSDIVVFPETAIIVPVDFLPEGLLAQFASAADRNGQTLLTGIFVKDYKTGEYLNSVLDVAQFIAKDREQVLKEEEALQARAKAREEWLQAQREMNNGEVINGDSMLEALQSPHDGEPLPLTTNLDIKSYSKHHLVPLGEYIPFPEILGRIYDYVNIPMSSLGRGGDVQPPIEAKGQKISFNICFEDSFGDEILKNAKGSTMLANIGNLGWFKGSNAMDIQIQHSQARALELGRYMVRVNNTGLTAIIGTKGDILNLIPRDVEQVLVGKVEGYTGETPYARIGGSIPLTIFLAIFAILLLMSGKFGGPAEDDEEADEDFEMLKDSLRTVPKHKKRLFK